MALFTNYVFTNLYQLRVPTLPTSCKRILPVSKPSKVLLDNIFPSLLIKTFDSEDVLTIKIIAQVENGGWPVVTGEHAILQQHNVSAEGSSDDTVILSAHSQ